MLGSASLAERRKYHPSVDAVCAGYSETTAPDGTIKKSRNSTMLNSKSMTTYARSVSLGPRTRETKLLYSDNYGSHDNDESTMILERKNIETRHFFANSSHLMQPVDQGPGKFVQDVVESYVSH